MATKTVEFQFLTGLRRGVFRNARLVGSWDGSGRFSEVWSESRMLDVAGEDGCPVFQGSVSLEFGGGWLLEVCQEREVQRREAYRLKRRKAARPPKRRAPEVGVEGTAGAVSGQRDGVPFQRPRAAVKLPLVVRVALNRCGGSASSHPSLDWTGLDE